MATSTSSRISRVRSSSGAIAVELGGEIDRCCDRTAFPPGRRRTWPEARPRPARCSSCSPASPIRSRSGPHGSSSDTGAVSAVKSMTPSARIQLPCCVHRPGARAGAAGHRHAETPHAPADGAEARAGWLMCRATFAGAFTSRGHCISSSQRRGRRVDTFDNTLQDCMCRGGAGRSPAPAACAVRSARPDRTAAVCGPSQ